MTTKNSKGSKGSEDKTEVAAETPAAEAGTTEAPAAAAPGSTSAIAPVVPADQVDQVDDVVAALQGKLPPELYQVLSQLHARQRAVEQHVQAARGDQIGVLDQVADLRRVVTQNADAIDHLADLMAPPPPEEAAPVLQPPQGNPQNPFTVPQRPHVAADAGMGLGGIAGRRRDRGARRFEGAGLSAPAEVARVALPPHNPNAAVLPAVIPEVVTPTRPTVLGELQIDPHKLGVGDHEMTIDGKPVLVRVRTAARPPAMQRRQGAGRVFRPAGR